MKLQVDHSRVGAAGALLWQHADPRPNRTTVVSSTIDMVF